MINSTFPGKWERVKDVFILAVGDTYKANTSGGEATHKLTVDEMPSHNHLVYSKGQGTSDRFDIQKVWENGTMSFGGGIGSIIGYTGGDQPHNNMPPYKTYYCWERIE